MKKLVSVILSLLMILSMTACANSASDAPAASTASAAPTATGSAALTGVEDGVLTVGMECAYAPYNWTQMDDSNGAVPIANNPGAYANGYDVMIAKKICEANGWELEVMAIGWDGLVPALNAGQLDAVIAGQSMTETRLQEVDMAGPYFYASIVCVTRKDSPLASATGISQLSGSCTAQTGTIWYDSCLPQIKDAQRITAEVWGICPGFSCWVVREHLPDCHKNLCEALSLAVRIILFFLWVFRISMDRFPKRFIFYCKMRKHKKERSIPK